MIGRRRQAGLTLMELLVSTVIVMIITGAVTRAFIAGTDFERTSETRRSLEEGRQRFEERISSMLKQAYVSADQADATTYFIAVPTTGSTSDGSDNVVFTARGDRLPYAVLTSTDDFETGNQRFGPQGGVVELSLATVPVGETASQQSGLFLREQRPADGDHTQGGEETLLNPEITDIRFLFYDGTQWVGEWDTQDTQRRIPAIVHVIYRVGDETEDHHIYVRLPLSDVTTDDPVTIGEGAAPQ